MNFGHDNHTFTTKLYLRLLFLLFFLLVDKEGPFRMEAYSVSVTVTDGGVFHHIWMVKVLRSVAEV